MSAGLRPPAEPGPLGEDVKNLGCGGGGDSLSLPPHGNPRFGGRDDDDRGYERLSDNHRR